MKKTIIISFILFALLPLWSQHKATLIHADANLYKVDSLLYRSEQLVAEDKAIIKNIPIKSIVNLRYFTRGDPFARIKGKWISSGDFVVFHRVAIAPNHLGRGLAKILLQQIEQFTCDKGIHSLRADTNFDNASMLHLFENLGYQYCGEVSFRGSPRKAFEKIL